MLVPEKKIEVYRKPAAGRFSEKKIFGPEGQLKRGAVPEFVLDLEMLFAK